MLFTAPAFISDRPEISPLLGSSLNLLGEFCSSILISAASYFRGSDDEGLGLS